MMTLLEAISPTARQLLMMPRTGITKAPKNRTHAVREDGRPLCGGGFQSSAVSQWQTDLGGVNCAACLGIIERRAT